MSAALLFSVSCQKSGTEGISRQPLAIKVKTAMVKESLGEERLSYSGTVTAYQSIPVTFRTPGTVQSVLVEEGMAVRKGQVLATLDKSDLQSVYNLSEAQYKQAKDAYDRLQEVYRKGSLAEIKWVEMESNLKQAQSSMELAKSNLEKAVLLAPENGIVGKRSIEPGMSSIGLNAPFEVVKIEKVYVKVSVAENEIALIEQGMDAYFSVPAVGPEAYRGKVAVVGVVADRISRTYEVKVLADNAGLKLKPGMVCDVVVPCRKKQMLTVDYRAVTNTGDGAFVYKVAPSGKSVIKQQVTVGQTTREGIEVLAGLNAGDQVVCQGKDKLKDNSLIVL